MLAIAFGLILSLAASHSIHVYIGLGNSRYAFA